MGKEHLASDLALELLQSGRSIRLPVTGWSMKPLIPPGSVLRIAPLRKPPRIGDIVLLALEGRQLIAHRIRALGPDSVQTKGDACARCDGPCSRTQIAGKVVGVDKPFSLALDTPLARALGRVVGSAFPRMVQLKALLRQGPFTRGAPHA